MVTLLRLLSITLLLTSAQAVFANTTQTLPVNTDTLPLPTLQTCTTLPDAERLRCYDEIAHATIEEEQKVHLTERDGSTWDNAIEDTPINNTPLTETAAQNKSSTVNDTEEDEVRITGDELPESTGSTLERMWGLTDETQSSLFSLQPYSTSYILFAQHADRVNRQPTSPAPGRETSISRDYRHVEAKFQISLKSKVGHNFIFPNDSLWFGYTQVSQWQIWSSHISRPFRATSYMPEVFYVIPTQLKIPATSWTWRMASIGIIHESNGQSNPLSRSWNRAYLGLGLDSPNMAMYVRFWNRFSESTRSDDNPHISRYMGRADLRFDWDLGKGNNLGFRVASNLSDIRKGSVQVDYYFPLSRFWGMGNHLRGYVQAFHGFGETISDYNFRRTTIGFGVALKQW